MATFRGKRIFVTGAGGFIGSHLVERLLQDQAHVTCFLRYTSSSGIGNLRYIPENVMKSARIEHGDIRDSERLKRLVEGHELVFHLASSISIPYSYLGIKDVLSTNVDGTLNILIAAKNAGVERFIHTSTSEVYGSGQYFPMDEKHPLCAQSPYSASKIAADKLAESFYKSYNLPVVMIRPFNTYGPRQSARAIIPTIIVQALKNENIALGSIEPKRDFTYISDTVAGFLKAAECQHAIGEVFNIGTGDDMSVRELCRRICEIVGVEKGILRDERRIRPEESEVVRLQADYSKAESILGYSPQIGIEEGLRRTIEFIRENIEIYGRAGVYRL